MSFQLHIPELTIANYYLRGELAADNAATQLIAEDSAFGSLLAGEVMLDQVTTGEEQHTASALVETARQYYEDVISWPANAQWEDDYIVSRIRARMRLAQLSVLEALYSEKTLPERQPVEDMYHALLELAVATLNTPQADAFDKSPPARQIRGTLGELAVLLLAQRFTLREIGTNEWLPLQSSFSEDTAGNCLIHRPEDYAWDLNIFTPSDPDVFPDKTYRLQIRTSGENRLFSPAGPTLYVNPDLGLDPREHWIEKTIIASCEIEASNPNRAERLTSELDERTDRFLAVIEEE